MKITTAFVLALVLGLGACSSDMDNGGSESSSMSSMKEMGPRMASEYAFPGFSVYEVDGRLWVFRDGSKGLMEFQKSGEPAESVTMIGAGPKRMTVKSDERETLLAYTSTKPGFRVYAVDERLWVFREGSEAHAEYMSRGLPAECATKVGAGPRHETVRSSDLETIEAYLASWR